MQVNVEPTVERIGSMQCSVGERLIWHAGEQALYWTDIPGRKLWSWNFFSGQINTWDLPEMAMETGISLSSPAKAGVELAPLERLATVGHPRPDMRFNDGRCNRQGRFLAGIMVLGTSLGLPLGKLYRFDARGCSQGRRGCHRR